MLNYEKTIQAIENIMGDYSNHKFDQPITKQELEDLLGVDISDYDWNNNRQLNEYNTNDITLSLNTNEEITIAITVEVDDNDHIRQILNVDEY